MSHTEPIAKLQLNHTHSCTTTSHTHTHTHTHTHSCTTTSHTLLYRTSHTLLYTISHTLLYHNITHTPVQYHTHHTHSLYHNITHTPVPQHHTHPVPQFTHTCPIFVLMQTIFLMQLNSLCAPLPAAVPFYIKYRFIFTLTCKHILSHYNLL